MEAALALLITINTDYNVQLRIILYLKLFKASYQIAGKKSMAENRGDGCDKNLSGCSWKFFMLMPPHCDSGITSLRPVTPPRAEADSSPGYDMV